MKTQFEREAFAVGLKKLLDPTSHFSICDFDKLMEMAGILVPSKERVALSVLHCVNYRDMSRECKEGLIEKIGEILQRGPDPMFTLREILHEEPSRPVIQIRHSWFQRLLRKNS